MDAPEGREAARPLQTNAANFADFSESGLNLTEEHEVVDFTS